MLRVLNSNVVQFLQPYHDFPYAWNSFVQTKTCAQKIIICEGLGLQSKYSLPWLPLLHLLIL